MPEAAPLSYWVGFHIFIVALMGAELLYVRRQAPEKLHSRSIVATVWWVGAALLFGAFIFRSMGATAGTQYLAGYAIEQSLSIDNLFVFLLLFGIFRIEPERQRPVLFWGVVGAIVMRGVFILAGIQLLERFSWVKYAFGALLLVAAIKVALPRKEEDEHTAPRWLLWLSRIKPVSLRQDRFFAIQDGVRMPTVLFLTLVAIELTDLVFAIDSIPAVLSITRHPFIAYTSNIMAVMGLRSLYFVLAHLLKRLRYLHYGLAAVLGFAALKMLAAKWWEVGPLVSLAIIIAILGVTILLSLLRNPSARGTETPAG